MYAEAAGGGFYSSGSVTAYSHNFTAPLPRPEVGVVTKLCKLAPGGGTRAIPKESYFVTRWTLARPSWCAVSQPLEVNNFINKLDFQQNVGSPGQPRLGRTN